jgi:hypothetical protein
MSRKPLFLAAAVALLCLSTTRAASLTDSLKEGTPEIKSLGALAFGPEGILFVGDHRAAAIFAIATGDTSPSDVKEGLKVANLNEKLASLLGIEAKQIKINDLAVNPLSTNAYLTVTSTDPKAPSLLIKIDRMGKISEFPLKGVKFAQVALSNATEGKNRQEAITNMAYQKGTLYVAGLSNEEFASKLRAIPFPFKDADKGTSIEIYHGAHGAVETRSPVRTFVPYDINGEAHILAAYTCTPLVSIPVKDLKPGEKVKGTTVAELGNRNRPLDMIVYKKDGKDYILMANSARGMMKIPTEGIDKVEAITTPIKGGGLAGLKYETIKGLEGVEQMAKLDRGRALILSKDKNGGLNLDTIDLP